MTASGLRTHDQRVSYAAAQVIADMRGGGDVRVLSRPDEEDRENRAVDLITADDVGELAIEHTRIEPFEGEIAEHHRVGPYEQGLRELLAGRLPAESQFHLVLEVRATHGIGATPERLDQIAGWVEREAPRLAVGSPRTTPRHWVCGGQPALPFAAKLYRWRQAADSSLPSFSCRMALPRDIEDRRAERIARGLEHKRAELLAEAGHERQGVQVLESADIQLSNAWEIATAVWVAGATVAPLPEWIVLVETDALAPIAWILRGSGEWIDEIEPHPLPRDSTPSAEVNSEAHRTVRGTKRDAQRQGS